MLCLLRGRLVHNIRKMKGVSRAALGYRGLGLRFRTDWEGLDHSILETIFFINLRKVEIR
mgnify:CR=1 FL=1|jgi:hypothetical protein